MSLTDQVEVVRIEPGIAAMSNYSETHKGGGEGQQRHKECWEMECIKLLSLCCYCIRNADGPELYYLGIHLFYTTYF